MARAIILALLLALLPGAGLAGVPKASDFPARRGLAPMGRPAWLPRAVPINPVIRKIIPESASWNPWEAADFRPELWEKPDLRESRERGILP